MAKRLIRRIKNLTPDEKIRDREFRSKMEEKGQTQSKEVPGTRERIKESEEFESTYDTGYPLRDRALDKRDKIEALNRHETGMTNLLKYFEDQGVKGQQNQHGTLSLKVIDSEKYNNSPAAKIFGDKGQGKTITLKELSDSGSRLPQGVSHNAFLNQKLFKDIEKPKLTMREKRELVRWQRRRERLGIPITSPRPRMDPYPDDKPRLFSKGLQEDILRGTTGGSAQRRLAARQSWGAERKTSPDDYPHQDVRHKAGGDRSGDPTSIKAGFLAEEGQWFDEDLALRHGGRDTATGRKLRTPDWEVEEDSGFVKVIDTRETVNGQPNPNFGQESAVMDKITKVWNVVDDPDYRAVKLIKNEQLAGRLPEGKITTPDGVVIEKEVQFDRNNNPIISGTDSDGRPIYQQLVRDHERTPMSLMRIPDKTAPTTITRPGKPGRHIIPGRPIQREISPGEAAGGIASFGRSPVAGQPIFRENLGSLEVLHPGIADALATQRYRGHVRGLTKDQDTPQRAYDKSVDKTGRTVWKGQPIRTELRPGPSPLRDLINRGMIEPVKQKDGSIIYRATERMGGDIGMPSPGQGGAIDPLSFTATRKADEEISETGGELTGRLSFSDRVSENVGSIPDGRTTKSLEESGLGSQGEFIPARSRVESFPRSTSPRDARINRLREFLKLQAERKKTGRPLVSEPVERVQETPKIDFSTGQRYTPSKFSQPSKTTPSTSSQSKAKLSRTNNVLDRIKKYEKMSPAERNSKKGKEFLRKINKEIKVLGLERNPKSGYGKDRPKGVLKHGGQIKKVQNQKSKPKRKSKSKPPIGVGAAKRGWGNTRRG
jgi:hypothetical protein